MDLVLEAEAGELHVDQIIDGGDEDALFGGNGFGDGHWLFNQVDGMPDSRIDDSSAREAAAKVASWTAKSTSGVSLATIGSIASMCRNTATPPTMRCGIPARSSSKPARRADSTICAKAKSTDSSESIDLPGSILGLRMRAIVHCHQFRQ